MRVNTIHSPWYYLAVGIATFGLCAFILHTFYHESFAEKKTIYMQSKLNEALIQYTALDAIFNSRVQTLFEHFINTPEITALMRDATLADETRQPLFGFDAGPLFNGFQHIFPLFYQNIFVGTVEISYPLNALREQAIERFPAGYD